MAAGLSPAGRSAGGRKRAVSAPLPTPAQLAEYLEARRSGFPADLLLSGETDADGVRLWLSQQGRGAAAQIEAAVFAEYGARTALEAGLRALASVASRRALLPLEEGRAPLVYRVVSGPRGPEYRAARRGY